MSYAAYAGAQKASETPRDLEIRAISYITRQLVDATKSNASPIDRTRALNGNIRLWSLLVKDLCSPNNALPDVVKAKYISLGLFCRRTSIAALSGRADLSILIRINTDVLDALEGQRAIAA